MLARGQALALIALVLLAGPARGGDRSLLADHLGPGYWLEVTRDLEGREDRLEELRRWYGHRGEELRASGTTKQLAGLAVAAVGAAFLATDGPGWVDVLGGTYLSAGAILTVRGSAQVTQGDELLRWSTVLDHRVRQERRVADGHR